MRIVTKALVALFIIIITALVFLGVYRITLSVWEFTTFRKEPAIITSCDSKLSCSYRTHTKHCGYSYYPVAQLKNGAKIIGNTGIPESSCLNKINESVNVLIDSDNTSNGVIYSPLQFWLLPLIILFFFFVLSSIGIPLLKQHRKA